MNRKSIPPPLIWNSLNTRHCHPKHCLFESPFNPHHSPGRTVCRWWSSVNYRKVRSLVQSHTAGRQLSQYQPWKSALNNTASSIALNEGSQVSQSRQDRRREPAPLGLPNVKGHRFPRGVRGHGDRQKEPGKDLHISGASHTADRVARQRCGMLGAWALRVSRANCLRGSLRGSTPCAPCLWIEAFFTALSCWLTKDNNTECMLVFFWEKMHK